MIKVDYSTVERLVKLKEQVKSKIEARLSPKEIEEARRDYHAKREPIVCGIYSK